MLSNSLSSSPMLSAVLSLTILAIVVECSLSYPAAMVFESQLRGGAGNGVGNGETVMLKKPRLSVRSLFHELRSINTILGDEDSAGPGLMAYEDASEDDEAGIPQSLVFQRPSRRMFPAPRQRHMMKRSWFTRTNRELHLPSIMEELASSMGEQSGDQASKFVRFAVKGRK